MPGAPESIPMTSPWLLGSIGVVTAWFLLAKPNRELKAGLAYLVTFEIPPSVQLEELQQLLVTGPLKSLFPEGSRFELSRSARVLSVRFVSPFTGKLTDVVTPLGTFKLVSVQELG